MPYRSAYPLRSREASAAAEARANEPTRSHAAIPVAVVLLAVGLYVGTITVLASGLIGVILLVGGGALLSTRINPLSVGFYLTRKPSWAAVGTIFLSAFVLFYASFYYVAHGLGPIIPHGG